MILFSCVAANYLGLIQAIEKTIGRKIPVVNCSRCFSFWLVFLWSLFTTKRILSSVAVAFLCSILAPWLEISLGLIDSIYNELYDKIFTTAKSSKKNNS